MSTMTVPKTDSKKFEYSTARIRDFSIKEKAHVKTENKGGAYRVTPASVASVSINGEDGIVPTKRFWHSMQVRFGFSPNIFRYFSHAEVFNRISEKAPDDTVRYCIERGDSKPHLLAVTNPKTAIVKNDDLMELLGRSDTQGMSYIDGIVQSTHQPRVNNGAYKILGDDFCNQFELHTPIDGFGKPNIYLRLLRLICTNGMVGISKAFRSEVNIGKDDADVGFTLQRAIEGYNNEEGFNAIRDRIDSAGNSWASVNECNRLYRVLSRAASAKGLETRGRDMVRLADGGTEIIPTASPIFHDFHKLTGDLNHIYGLTSLDTLSIKRQRTLPAACKVYDLINFASETATHHAKSNGAKAVQTYIGSLLSNEYDLEGTTGQFSDWRDFFVGSEKTAETMAVLAKK